MTIRILGKLDAPTRFRAESLQTEECIVVYIDGERFDVSFTAGEYSEAEAVALMRASGLDAVVVTPEEEAAEKAAREAWLAADRARADERASFLHNLRRKLNPKALDHFERVPVSLTVEEVEELRRHVDRELEPEHNDY